MQVTQYAVIQTASIMESGIVVPYASADGALAPAVVYVHEDRAKVVRMKKRLENRAKRHVRLRLAGVGEMASCQPIYGTCEISVEIPAKKPRPTVEPSTNGEHASKGRGRKKSATESAAV